MIPLLSSSSRVEWFGNLLDGPLRTANLSTQSSPLTCRCICSSVTPLVSGKNSSTTMNCRTAMERNRKNGPAVDCAASDGKTPDIKAFVTQ